MNLFKKILLPLLIVFITITIFIFTSTSFFIKNNIDGKVLMIANTFLLILAIIVFFLQKKALQNSNPNVFIRSIIGGTMIKMFGTVIAVLIYVLQTGNNYNKKAVFIALFIYLIYLFVEVICMSKIVRKNK